MRAGLHAAGVLTALATATVSPGAAQDVRGLEVCTAEKQMERRTGCLQANIEFLQQRLNKVTLDGQQKQAAADREISVLKKDIAALADVIAKLREKVENAEKAKKDR